MNWIPRARKIGLAVSKYGGDVQAIRQRKVGRRVARRVAGKVVGRGFFARLFG